VRRRLEDPEFAGQVERLRVSVMLDVFDELRAAGPKAIGTLVELLDPPTPAGTRLAAARVILDNLPRFHDAIEIEHRVRTLESAVPDEADFPRFAA
jgi:hypothetical protein